MVELTGNSCSRKVNSTLIFSLFTQHSKYAVLISQELAGTSGAGRVDMGKGVDALQLDRPVTLAELRRHKRVFLKMSTQSLASRLSDRQSARRMFVNYLREHLT